MKSLEGKVALVAGATRGAGRGIARMLGEAGATVYCTGRSVRGEPATGGRQETIEETAEIVTANGGVGHWMRVDHSVEEQVKALFVRIREEQGHLDVLVNDVWGGDELTEWGKPFWELSMSKGLLMLQRAVHTHIITSRYGVPLMVHRDAGLIVEVTDGDFLGYRGNLFYDLAKISAIRLAYAMSTELADRHITSLAVTPGFLRSEAMLDHFGVTESNWQDATEKDRHFAESETPGYIGRAVAALAADPNVSSKAGRVLATWTLAKEYGFHDVDGRQPDWGGYIDRTIASIVERGAPVSADELFLLRMRQYQLQLNPERADEASRIAALIDESLVPEGLRYRELNPGEEGPVASLVARVFQEYVAPEFSREGCDEFFEYASPQAMLKRRGSESFFLVAEAGDEIVGMIEVRNHEHVAMLFVEQRRRGIARELMNRAITICREKRPEIRQITVHSSSYAEPIYRRMGFHPVGAKRTENGITYIPMAVEFAEKS